MKYNDRRSKKRLSDRDQFMKDNEDKTDYAITSEKIILITTFGILGSGTT